MENIENSIDTMQAFHNVNAAYDHDSDWSHATIMK